MTTFIESTDYKEITGEYLHGSKGAVEARVPEVSTREERRSGLFGAEKNVKADHVSYKAWPAVGYGVALCDSVAVGGGALLQGRSRGCGKR